MGVRGYGATLDLLSQLIENPKAGYKTKMFEVDYLMRSSVKKSYWALTTKELVSTEKVEAKGEYQTPTVLEATTSILTHYVRRGERLCSVEKPSFSVYNSQKFTKCQEMHPQKNSPISVGGFDCDKLYVIEDMEGCAEAGPPFFDFKIAATRKL